MTHTSTAIRDSLFRMTLRSEIEITANPERIWEILTDFKGYSDWNPAILHAEGEARKGTLLRVVIHWPGLKPGPYVLEVLEAKPELELRWLGHFWMKGLMDGDHSFVIEANEGITQVVQTENFSGLLIPFFAPWLKKNVLDGFALMNAALKNRAEHSQEPILGEKRLL